MPGFFNNSATFDVHVNVAEMDVPMTRCSLERFGLAGLSLSFAFCGAIAAFGADKDIAAPPVPKIVTLKLEPAKLALKDVRDERRVLVMGKTEARNWIDLTSEAKLKSESGAVAIDSAGSIRAKDKGKGENTVSAAGQEAKLDVTVEDASVPPVRFVRDVEPILSKAGCNAGTCHGSAKGKNGFKLSLRGYDPDFDYQALIND